MSMTPAQQLELNELLAALREKQITAQQSAQLNALLREHPSARQRYLEHHYLCAALHWLHGDNAEPSEYGGLSASPARPFGAFTAKPDHSPVLGFLGRTSAALGRPVVLSIGAVGLLFCIYAGVLFWNLRSGDLPSEIAGDRLNVATITSASEDARWSPDSNSPLSPGGRGAGGKGAEITKDSPLSIQSGLVELQLKQGTTLLIEGPAEWSIDGANNATLTRGKLVAKVPQQAVGFTLETPTAKIVDLGTEFGVEVAEDGETSAHVFRGLVDVSQPQARNDEPASSTVRLTAGESARVTPRHGITKAEHRGKAEFVARRIPAAQGQTQIAIFQQGAKQPFAEGPYAGCRDTQLIAWGADGNFGRRANWDVGNLEGKPARALLRFDLTPLAGKFSRIVSAKLVLNQDPVVPVLVPGVVDVHLLLAVNREWVEGVGRMGSVNAADNVRDGATWLQRQSGSPWLDRSGQPVEGAAYEPSRLASWKYKGGYSNRPIEIPLEGDLSFLAAWADNDDSNAGFLLCGEPFKASNRISFYSADAPIVEARPALVVEFIPKVSLSKSVTPKSSDADKKTIDRQ